MARYEWRVVHQAPYVRVVVVAEKGKVVVKADQLRFLLVYGSEPLTCEAKLVLLWLVLCPRGLSSARQKTGLGLPGRSFWRSLHRSPSARPRRTNTEVPQRALGGNDAFLPGIKPGGLFLLLPWSSSASMNTYPRFTLGGPFTRFPEYHTLRVRGLPGSARHGRSPPSRSQRSNVKTAAAAVAAAATVEILKTIATTTTT